MGVRREQGLEKTYQLTSDLPIIYPWISLFGAIAVKKYSGHRD